MKTQFPIIAAALCVVLAAVMATASAQSYKWVDKDGKVRYGDVPPPGVKVTTLKAPPPSATPPAAPAAKAGAKDAAKDAKKGPLTPVEQEQEFRKRKLEEEEARKKQEETIAAEQARKVNCERAQEGVRQLESGQRIARTDAKGETYYVEDEQRFRELASARKTAAEWCAR